MKILSCVLLLLFVVTSSSGHNDHPPKKENPDPQSAPDVIMELPDDDDDDDDDYDEEEEEKEIKDAISKDDDDDDHIEDITCDIKKLVINGETLINEVKKNVKICVVEDFLDDKNHTNPDDLILTSPVEGVYNIFEEGKIWTLPHNSGLIYPILIRVAFKKEACAQALVKHISFEVADEHEAQVRIGGRWHHYENNQDNNNDHSFHIDFNEPSQSSYFDIFLDKVPGYRGGIGGLDLVVCCGGKK